MGLEVSQEPLNGFVTLHCGPVKGSSSCSIFEIDVDVGVLQQQFDNSGMTISCCVAQGCVALLTL